MAYQFAYADAFGNSYPAAYAILTSVACDKFSGTLALQFNIYGSKAARQAKAQPVYQISATIPNGPVGTPAVVAAPAASATTAAPVTTTAATSAASITPPTPTVLEQTFQQGYLAYNAVENNFFAANNATAV